MRNFKEFIAVFCNDDDIVGKKQEDNGYITIDLNCVCAWNQADNNTISVDLQGGTRYKLDIHYNDFCKIMKENGNT